MISASSDVSMFSYDAIRGYELWETKQIVIHSCKRQFQYLQCTLMQCLADNSSLRNQTKTKPYNKHLQICRNSTAIVVTFRLICPKVVIACVSTSVSTLPLYCQCWSETIPTLVPQKTYHIATYNIISMLPKGDHFPWLLSTTQLNTYFSVNEFEQCGFSGSIRPH